MGGTPEGRKEEKDVNAKGQAEGRLWNEGWRGVEGGREGRIGSVEEREYRQDERHGEDKARRASRHGKAWQGKARQGNGKAIVRQGKARQDKTRQDKARQGKARQGKARRKLGCGGVLRSAEGNEGRSRRKGRMVRCRTVRGSPGSGAGVTERGGMEQKTASRVHGKPATTTAAVERHYSLQEHRAFSASRVPTPIVRFGL